MLKLFAPPLFIDQFVGICDKTFYIPDEMRRFRIKATAHGGSGGLSNGGVRGGGGGGAGMGIDEEFILKPNSLLRVTYDMAVNVGMRIFLVQMQDGTIGGYDAITEINLLPGRDGGNASGTAPGTGGYSGAGCYPGIPGAAAPFLERIPTGLLGKDYLLTDVAGGAGNDASVISTMVNLGAIANIGTGNATKSNTQYRVRFPSPVQNIAGQGGPGGCSIFGPGSRFFQDQGGAWVSAPGAPGAGQQGHPSTIAANLKQNSDAAFYIWSELIE